MLKSDLKPRAWELWTHGWFSPFHASHGIMFSLSLSFFSFFFFFFFGGGRAAPAAYGVPRLGVKSELRLLAYATATATPDPSCVHDLHHSSQHCWILYPLSEAADPTRILSDTELGS